MKYGAAYDAEGNFFGIYYASRESDVLANTPNGGRMYFIPGQGSNSLPLPIQPLRDMLSAQVRANREIAQQAGCLTPFGRIDTDTASQLKILGAVVTAQIAPTGWSIDWTMEDNSIVTLNAEQIGIVGLAVSQHVDACHQYGRTLDAALQAASTIPDAYAVIETAVWPG